MTFAIGLLLLLWVVVSILANGVALLHYKTRLRGIELLGYGAAAGVSLHALLGWGIAVASTSRWIFLAFLIAATVGSVVYLIARGVPSEFRQSLTWPQKLSLGCWTLLLLFCLALLFVDVRFPDPLPDGRYVFKQHTTNVKLQYLTALPADNYIPFAVTEFFLRGISFKKNRPILPGNEVSNRTILMSLVALPFRAALGAPHDRPRLGTFRYVEHDWPDVSTLNSGDSFAQFAVVGFVLNSLMLLGLFVFCSSLTNAILPFATVLYITNPYFIAQTVFTWPKALAGFFILLAWHSIRRGHPVALVAALMALAYHAHPYAIVFAGCAGVYYLTQWREKSRIPRALVYLTVFALLLAPWILWTRLVLHIPSDLVAQNFTGPETAAAWASPINFGWIRLYNLFCLFVPLMFSVYPFNLAAVVDLWLICLPGVVGLVLFYPAMAMWKEMPPPRAWLWYGLLGPGLLLVSVFSNPALSALHGYQPILGLLLFFGVCWLYQHCTRRVCVGLVALQLLLNLSLLLARGKLTGVRFW